MIPDIVLVGLSCFLSGFLCALVLFKFEVITKE